MTPPDCDLQDFEFMPVMVRRLLKSETWSLGSGDERAAAIALWFESWHQVPAASLPNNDKLLARLADTQKWAKVKEQALRGWVECSDGRLYHPVVAEKALEAWLEKLLNSISGAAGNAKRWGIEIDAGNQRAQFMEAVGLLRKLAPQSKSLKKKAVLTIAAGSPPDSPGDRKGDGQGQGEGNLSVPDGTGDKPPKPTDPDEIIFGYGVPLLTAAGSADKDARSFLGKLRKVHGDNAVIEKLRECFREKPIQPLTWLAAALPPAAPTGKANKQVQLEQKNLAVAAQLAGEPE
jgi:hypothetical protein